MPQLAAHLSPAAQLSPAALMAQLAASGRYEQYLAYERHGVWTFAGGVSSSAVLDTEALVITAADGAVTRLPWSERPALALDQAMRRLLAEADQVFGFVNFEFGAYRPGVSARLKSGTALATLFAPRTLVQLTDDAVVVCSADEAECAAVHDLLSQPEPDDPRRPTPVDLGLDPSDYRGRVAQAVREIQLGEYQKVILSRRVELPFVVDFPATYAAARSHNTPVRSFLLDLGGLKALGFSPEMVAVVNSAGGVVTEPLAGTRAFGRGHDADQAARSDLVSNVKEIHEHAISVRGSLEDLAAVVEPSSAMVKDFMTVRERGSVQHLGSTVTGQLLPTCTQADALEALFPAVTASGLPKNQGIDAIMRLDESPRGLYSGAVLAADSDGGLDAALVLRAVFEQEGRTWLRAGAGIVAHSSPEREFEETKEKLGCVAEYLIARDQ